MTIFSDETAHRIRSTLVNARSEPEIAIPITDDITVKIESQQSEPVNRTWSLCVTLTTTEIIPEDTEENKYAYLHEVNDEGQAFVDSWLEIIDDFPWLTEYSWDFMLSSVYNCGSDVEMATYTERVTVNTEDLLDNVEGNERLVRVSYTVPREMFVIVDEDVDINDPKEVVSNGPNLGWDNVPVVELEPEMMNKSMEPWNSSSIPTVDIDDVDDISVDVIESEYNNTEGTHNDE